MILDPLALWGKEMSREEMMRLIEAAPDLLEIVYRLDTILRGMGPLYSTGETAADVRAAIAKATGGQA